MKKLSLLVFSIELWFTGQCFHDHLEQDGSNVPFDQVE